MSGAPLRFTTLASPIGQLLLLGDGVALRGLYLQDGYKPAAVLPGWSRDPDAFGAVAQQLEQYFAGERRRFELELDPLGTPFQLQVWEALRQIPYGEAACYSEVARRVGRPGAARAVGAANGSNPLSIVLPCHRLVGSNGTLTGYAGGIEAKRMLLDLEAGSASRPASYSMPSCLPSGISRWQAMKPTARKPAPT